MANTRKKRETVQSESKPKRIPVGEARDVLNVAGKDPSRKYRWVIDKNDGQRLLTFTDAGYRFETDKSNLKVGTRKVSDSSGEGEKIYKYVGIDKEGNKEFAYLMSISKEWFQEDQDLKAQKIDELESGMEVSEDIDYGSIKMGGAGRTVTITK